MRAWRGVGIEHTLLGCLLRGSARHCESQVRVSGITSSNRLAIVQVLLGPRVVLTRIPMVSASRARISAEEDIYNNNNRWERNYE
jgi:hypothetical protein